jgi:hypothetical protein
VADDESAMLAFFRFGPLSASSFGRLLALSYDAQAADAQGALHHPNGHA